MEQNGHVFDAGRPIAIKIRSGDGIRTIALRFPTDDEWIQRQRRRKSIRKKIGRDAFEWIPPSSEETDAELIASLRNGDDGPELDGFEASRILEELSQAEVDDVMTEPEGFRVVLRVPGAVTTHLLRMPTAKESTLYRKGFWQIVDLPHNKESISMNLRLAGDLYASLSKETTGYVGAVPIIHQAWAVKATMDALESGLGVAEPENF